MISDTSQMLYHEWLLVKEKELREEKEAKKHFTTKSKCVILNKSAGDI